MLAGARNRVRSLADLLVVSLESNPPPVGAPKSDQQTGPLIGTDSRLRARVDRSDLLDAGQKVGVDHIDVAIAGSVRLVGGAAVGRPNQA
jgi:hypothetical protein